MERDPEQAPGEVEVGEVDEGVGVVVGAGDEAGWGECVPVPGREENVFASAAVPQHLTKLEIPVFIKHVRSVEARWYENRFLLLSHRNMRAKDMRLRPGIPPKSFRKYYEVSNGARGIRLLRKKRLRGLS